MTLASIIAIDGPAASGKTTLGRRLAQKLGYLFIDTGAMYRAVTLACLERGVAVEDEAAVTQVAQSISIDLQPASVDNGRSSDVFLDGDDITWRIRSAAVDASVSLVSSYAGVREAMTGRQREIGSRGNVVMVGRDIGTVVLVNADLKVYLDASVEERAKRRYQEGLDRGESVVLEDILAAMQARDRFDKSRELAPLIIAADMEVLDSTAMTPDQAFQAVLDLVSKGERSQMQGVDPAEEGG